MTDVVSQESRRLGRDVTRSTMTREIARAAAQDAGNRRMRAGGRKVWSVGDYRHACTVMDDLLKLIPAE